MGGQKATPAQGHLPPFPELFSNFEHFHPLAKQHKMKTAPVRPAPMKENALTTLALSLSLPHFGGHYCILLLFSFFFCLSHFETRAGNMCSSRAGNGSRWSLNRQMKAEGKWNRWPFWPERVGVGRGRRGSNLRNSSLTTFSQPTFAAHVFPSDFGNIFQPLLFSQRCTLTSLRRGTSFSTSRIE